MDDHEYKRWLREIGAMMDNLGIGIRALRARRGRADVYSGHDRDVQKRADQFNAALLALREDCKRTGRMCPL